MHRDEITRSRGAGSRLTVPANPACEADFCGHAAGLKPRRAEEARLAGSALVAAGATRSFAKILLPPDPFLRHIKLRTICIMVLCDINMYFELSIFFLHYLKFQIPTFQILNLPQSGGLSLSHIACLYSADAARLPPNSSRKAGLQ